MLTIHPCARAPPFQDDCYYIRDFDASRLLFNPFPPVEAKKIGQKNILFTNVTKECQYRLQFPRARISCLIVKTNAEEPIFITNSNIHEYTDDRFVEMIAGKTIDIRVQMDEFDISQFSSLEEETKYLDTFTEDFNRVTKIRYKEDLTTKLDDAVIESKYIGFPAYLPPNRKGSHVGFKFKTKLTNINGPQEAPFPPTLNISNLSHPSEILSGRSALLLLRPNNIIYAQVMDGGIWKKNLSNGDFGHHLQMIQAIVGIPPPRNTFIVPEFILKESNLCNKRHRLFDADQAELIDERFDDDFETRHKLREQWEDGEIEEFA